MGGLERGSAGGGDAMAPASGVSRILVIESDAEARSNLAQFLAAHGYHVDEAGDGEEGLYRAHEAESSYDIVLLDDHLPDAAGLDMLPALKIVAPGALVVLMSCSSARERFFDAMACGAYEFLQKPLWLQEALRIVARGIRERRNGFVAEAVC